MLDCLPFSKTPNREDMLKGYLGISRVTTKEGLLIVQPYHPMLFRQGVLPGPELLMQFWRGQLQVKELEDKWQEFEESGSKLVKRLDKMTWACAACEQQDLKPEAFGASTSRNNAGQFHTEVMRRILARGACRYCVPCMSKKRAAKHEKIRCTGHCGVWVSRSHTPDTSTPCI